MHCFDDDGSKSSLAEICVWIGEIGVRKKFKLRSMCHSFHVPKWGIYKKGIL